MKKLTVLMMSVLCMGGVFAQQVTDTIPQPVMNGNNPAALGMPDTFPQERMNQDTSVGNKWNKDSLAQNEWRREPQKINVDTARKIYQDSAVSIKEDWKRQDSAYVSRKDNRNLVDSAVGGPDAKWKDNAMKKNKNDSSGAAPKLKKIISDRVAMKDGEMILIKNGNETKLLKNITLDNGSIVMPDGTVKYPDGNSVKLKKWRGNSYYEKFRKKAHEKIRQKRLKPKVCWYKVKHRAALCFCIGNISFLDRNHFQIIIVIDDDRILSGYFQTQ